MAAPKLYSYAGDFRALKALIAGAYNGVAIERPEFVLGKDNVTPEFLAKSPMGKVPVLETAQGCIWESNACVAAAGRGGEMAAAAAAAASRRRATTACPRLSHDPRLTHARLPPPAASRATSPRRAATRS
jgi:glutathione S-transferase